MSNTPQASRAPSTLPTPMAQIIQSRKIKQPLIFVKTHEESTTVSDIVTHLMDAGLANKIYSWDVRGVITDLTASEEANRTITLQDASLTAGMSWYLKPLEYESRTARGGGLVTQVVKEDNPAEHILSASGPINNKSVLILKDFSHLIYTRGAAGDPHSNNNLINRYLIEALPMLRKAWRTVIVLSHGRDVPPELQHLCQFVEFPLPDTEDLKRLVRIQACAKITVAATSEGAEQTPEIRLTEAGLESVARELQGLTSGEAEDALRISNIINAGIWQRNGRTSDREFDMASLRTNKATKLNRLSTLTLLEPTDRLRDVGGMEMLKDKIGEVSIQMDPESRKIGLRPPRGFMFVGPGGTGKTLLARALAAEWGLPTVMLDITRCKGSYVGQSEGQMRETLERIDRMSPVAIICDEFEKQWSGFSGSGATDSGVTAGMMSIFLEFMQRDREVPVIMIALSNSVAGIPAPVIRSGRFDSIIYVGLPGLAQRAEIFGIHLRKRTWDPAETSLDLDKLAKASVGFSGAEVEQSVKQGIMNKARRSGLGRDDPPNMEDMMAGIASITPSIRTHRAEYDALKRWVDETGVTRASRDEDVGTDYGISSSDKGLLAEDVSAVDLEM